MPFRKKGQEHLDGEFQRLRREIREELGRIHAGLPPEPPPEPEQERDGNAERTSEPAPDETPAPAAVSREPERSQVPLWQRLERLETMRSGSVSASPLIQQAALGQIKGAPAVDAAPPAKGAPRPVEDVAPSYVTIRQTTLHLETVATRLEVLIGRLVELTMWLSRAAHVDASQEPAEQPARTEPAEPRFDPRNGTVQLTVTDVPSLQNLMRVGRALSDLAAVADASIAGYEQGSAVLHVTMVESMSLNDLMRGLRDATTLQLLVEESRPEASRLRLRFVPEPKPPPEILRMPAPAPQPLEEPKEALPKAKQTRTKARARKRNPAPAPKGATERASSPSE
ncbi:MAG: hypothetical protein WEB04_07605 [Dehalococcoidia bacterium]